MASQRKTRIDHETPRHHHARGGGIWIISPQDTVLGHIQVPELVANVAFGDPDHKTLYIAARNSVYKIRTNVADIP
jgi:sugar lactone lactonase YvrE